MDKFEQNVKTAFDFTHFEDIPEMAELIRSFDEKYLAGQKGKNTRERISFSELSEETVKTNSPPDKNIGAKKEREL